MHHRHQWILATIQFWCGLFLGLSLASLTNFYVQIKQRIQKPHHSSMLTLSEREVGLNFDQVWWFSEHSWTLSVGTPHCRALQDAAVIHVVQDLEDLRPGRMISHWTMTHDMKKRNKM